MKIKLNKNQQKYGGGILAVLLLGLGGVWAFATPSEPMWMNPAIGAICFGVLGLVIWLIRRTT